MRKKALLGAIAATVFGAGLFVTWIGLIQVHAQQTKGLSPPINGQKPLQQSCTGGSDLQIQSIRVDPDPPDWDQPYEVHVGIINAGDVTVTVGTWAYLYFDKVISGTPDAQAYAPTTNLIGGAMITAHFYMSGTAQPGWHNVLVEIDATDAVSEAQGSCAGENNNQDGIQFNVPLQPTPTPMSYPLPTIVFFDPGNIVIPSGDPVTLRWRVSGQSVTVLLDGHSVSLEDSRTVYPTQYTVYQLYAVNPTGRVTATCAISIATPTPTPTPTLTPALIPSPTISPTSCPTPTIFHFAASATEVPRGSQVTLSWSAFNATEVYLNGRGVEGFSDKTVTVNELITYTLFAYNTCNQSSAQKEVSITLIEPTAVPHCDPPSIHSFEKSVSDTVPYGSPVTLHWDVSGADLVTLNGQGVPGKGTQTAPLYWSTNFDLYARSWCGKPITDRISIEVSTATPTPECDPPRIYSFAKSVHTHTVPSGSPVTLHWEISGADGVTLNGQPIPSIYTETFTLNWTTEFELCARRWCGALITDTIHITVNHALTPWVPTAVPTSTAAAVASATAIAGTSAAIAVTSTAIAGTSAAIAVTSTAIAETSTAIAGTSAAIAATGSTATPMPTITQRPTVTPAPTTSDQPGLPETGATPTLQQATVTAASTSTVDKPEPPSGAITEVQNPYLSGATVLLAVGILFLSIVLSRILSQRWIGENHSLATKDTVLDPDEPLSGTESSPNEKGGESDLILSADDVSADISSNPVDPTT